MRRALVVADVSAERVQGGAERMLDRHVRALLDAGWDAIVLTRQPSPEAPLLVKLRRGAVEHRLPWSGDRGARGLRELVREARLWLRTHWGAFDVVLGEQPFTLWALLRAGLDRPYLYSCYSFAHEEFETRHGLDRGLRVRLASAAMRRVERRVYRGARRIVALSGYTRRRLGEVFAVDEGRVAVIPGGARPVGATLRAQRAELRARLGWSHPVAITVRNLVPRTGVDLMIQAAAWLRRTHPELRWEVIGDGPCRAALEDLARGLGVDDVVRFRGFLPDREVVERTVAADLFVLPTRALEGFGLVTAEANLAGCPVVATPVGANPEVVGALPDNRLAARPDPEAIADAAAALLAEPWDEARREALAERAAERFAWRRHEEAFLAEVERLCASST